MSKDLIKIYLQLDDMDQTKEVIQIKNQTEEILYQNLRSNFLEVVNIGRVIGYDELEEELNKAIRLVQIQKSTSGK